MPTGILKEQSVRQDTNSPRTAQLECDTADVWRLVSKHGGDDYDLYLRHTLLNTKKHGHRTVNKHDNNTRLCPLS